MSTLPPVPALARFIKPTVDTPFHIDYRWWEEQGLDFNVQLLQHLSPELREAYSGQRLGEKIDLIDWDTGEVQQVEGLQYLITTRCSKEPDYILHAPTLLEAIFRAFLSNGNRPLSPRALAPLVGYPPERILRVLAGTTVWKGLRPVID
ncbi:MAG TPA: hypothetical protein PLH19_07360 [Anaerolineae bacterium]|nr:hypothetical protein [Anaerolineae bacterium]HQH38338.1 hypothetical protein [Anaerolineae bacterium]